MYDFKFADIGEGIHEGVVLKWEYKLGDTIEEGETLVVIETDKVNAEIPSPVTGVITKIGPDEGKTINVGETLAVIDDGEDSSTDSDDSSSTTEKKEEGSSVVGSIEIGSDVLENSNEQEEITISKTKKTLATPVARKLAKDLQLDINTIQGSGENGRVMKADIYQAHETGNKEETTVSKTKDIVVAPMTFDDNRTRRERISKRRQTISKNMTLSKAIIPHTTVMDEVIVSDLVDFRKSSKEMAKEQGVSLSYMPFILKALDLTLEKHPIFNSSFDHEHNEIVYKNYVNMGVAVDTPSGLIVPNIKNSNHLGIFAIAKELQIMKEKAAANKITLDDLQDGTITVTNYGVFDSTFGVPVIKHPEVAIIGIGKIAQKAVVVDNEIVIRHVLPLSLSIDHRVIDGGDAGRFLQDFKAYLKKPILLLLS